MESDHLPLLAGKRSIFIGTDLDLMNGVITFRSGINSVAPQSFTDLYQM